MTGYPHHHGTGPRALARYATACHASATILLREGRPQEARDLEAAAHAATPHEHTPPDRTLPDTDRPDPRDEQETGWDQPPEWWR